MREPQFPKKKIPTIPKPSPYHISEPFQDRGLWCFWLAADDVVLEYISNLNCILQPSFGSPLSRRMRGRVMFAINPRYDHEETWLWVTDLLDAEASEVELSDTWESAIADAQAPDV